MKGLGIGMDPRRIGKLLRNPSGVADLLTSGHPDTGESPAAIMADIINVMRADTKRLADLHGIDVEISLMTPERAGELLAGTISGDGIELVVMFNELADQRDKVLQEALTEEEYQAYDRQRRSVMYTELDDEA